MAELSREDGPPLNEIVSAIKEITDPHGLGVQLRVEDYQLEIFERNHQGDVERQKIEVIKHWMRNSECSWDALASAIEKMRKHGKLVKQLRERCPGMSKAKVDNSRSIQASTDTMRMHTSTDTRTSHACPTIGELKKYVRTFVGDKWEDLAVELGLDEDEECAKKLEEIKTKREDNSSMASYDVLKLWQGNQNANPSWEGLKRALKAVGLVDAVKSINEYLGDDDNSGPSPTAQQDSTFATCSKQQMPTSKFGLDGYNFNMPTSLTNSDENHNKQGQLYALHVIPKVKDRLNISTLHQRGLTGSGVSILVLDGGILKEHSEFVNRSVQPICYQTSPSYHGTACAAIAGGKDMGIAPDSELIVCQVSPDGKGIDRSKLLEILQRVVLIKQSGGSSIDIISMSFGFDETNQKISDEIKILNELGVVCVAASGNAGRHQKVLAFPARDKNVISVGACKPTGQPCDSNPEANIDVCAPGEDIELSSHLFSGSSFATPVVAGIIALMLQCANTLPADKTNIKKSIRKVETLQSLFAHDMKEHGKDLFAPYELLDKWWKDPNEIEVTCKGYC